MIASVNYTNNVSGRLVAFTRPATPEEIATAEPASGFRLPNDEYVSWLLKDGQGIRLFAEQAAAERDVARMLAADERAAQRFQAYLHA